MSQFTPVQSLVGGALIGLSASLLMLTHGRVAGVSGILGRWLAPQHPGQDSRWRAVFLGGMLMGGAAVFLAHPAAFSTSPAPLPLTAVSGLLVGLGTRLGNGCTSGHGVCGISRFSPRSIAATMAFMAAGMLTVRVVRAMVEG